MTLLDFLLLTVMGGVGASLRYAVDSYLRPRVHGPFDVTTTIINASGSLVLGFLTGLAHDQLGSPDAGLVAILGLLLGGYTTFSTASYETVRLIEQRQYGQAFVSSIGMLIVCVTLALLGVWLGDSL